MVHCGPGGCGTRWLGPAVVLIALLGCGGPTTYPVKGKLVFEKGDIKLLSGSIISCQHEQDPSIGARGDIQEDGSFTLETYVRGKIVPGALEGTYRARIIPEDGAEDGLFYKTRIDPRFLDAQASTLTFKVPAPDAVVLTVTRAKPGTKLGSEQPASGRACGGDDDDSGDSQH